MARSKLSTASKLLPSCLSTQPRLFQAAAKSGFRNMASCSWTTAVVGSPWRWYSMADSSISDAVFLVVRVCSSFGLYWAGVVG